MVTNINSVNSISPLDYNTKDNIKKTDDKDNNTKDTGNAQSLGTDTFVKSTEDDFPTYKPVKNKLSSEEVQALKEEQKNTEAELIKKFISDTINTQNNILGNSVDTGLSKESKDLLTKIFGSLENAYPKIATTPEEAQKAISDGGDYSVNAVSDRIMTMATALAGDDPNKLQEMRDAVEKGFEQAGLDFKNATKTDLPQISKDTYDEVMRRFDKLQNKNTDNDDSNKDTTTPTDKTQK